jgi:hypothetical protein
MQTLIVLIDIEDTVLKQYDFVDYFLDIRAGLCLLRNEVDFENYLDSSPVPKIYVQRR